ncbi:histidine kinase- DNA gyrase B- and HSP90-like domain-containing, putative [Babesia ovis]|uniref:Histidine kinase- DNA gyrase B- and HSP90-like domain-containing, putative n=1 Tax=Babesia ovis TaxID=5869 RepID=A0A9W5T8X6_BABOV|nr:histidine kinase- DNA gyrase B- and HSP90-like domain-containing, putative [Babesia ovis]
MPPKRGTRQPAWRPQENGEPRHLLYHQIVVDGEEQVSSDGRRYDTQCPCQATQKRESCTAFRHELERPDNGSLHVQVLLAHDPKRYQWTSDGAADKERSDAIHAVRRATGHGAVRHAVNGSRLGHTGKHSSSRGKTHQSNHVKVNVELVRLYVRGAGEVARRK